MQYSQPTGQGYIPQNPYNNPNNNPYFNNTHNNPYLNRQQRLHDLEQQNPQYGQTMQPAPQHFPFQQPPMQAEQVTSHSQPSNTIMSVANEQQARDYPADLSGAVQMFVKSDDSMVFAKRFNVATALIEFEAYERKTKESSNVPAKSVQDNTLLLGIVSEFSAKLENLFSEIQAIRKDLKNDKFDGDSKSTGSKKSSVAASNAASPTDGASGK